MFDSVIRLLSQFGRFLYPYMNDIAVAIMACLIVILGTRINRLLRSSLAGSGFVVRTLVFILVNAFGYGVAIVALSPLLAGQLKSIPSQWLGLVILATFIAIGAWAQRNNHA
jgi:hypothetical protein